MKKICVIGLGYVGLPTASLLANQNFHVHGVDINPIVIDTLCRGDIHITEPGLAVLVSDMIDSGYLTVSLEPENADIFIIAVPTPFKDDYLPDISYIKKAIQSIAPYITSGNLIILESTSPVGTTEKIAVWLKELRPDLDIESSVYIAYCPERVLPGNALHEIISNDRIIGGINVTSTEKANNLYSQFVTGEIFCTDSKTAELSKLAENSFRDVNIAFANELSIICDKLQVNIWELIKLANHHPRVNILNPGPGVGGHCIAVDPWFIVDSAQEEARLIRIAREVNDSKPDFVVAKVKEVAARFKEPKIACLGLSYKPDIDDLRESPAVKIVKKLLKSQIGTIFVVEPHLRKIPNVLKNEENLLIIDLDEALSQCNIIVLLVNHKKFSQIKDDRIKDKILLDMVGNFS